MKLLILLMPATSLLVSCASLPRSPEVALVPASEEPERQQLAQVLDQVVDELASEGFSGSVAVARAGRLLYSRAAGQALPDQPMQTSTAVDVMSISKVFTGVAILQLAQSGRLSLDDPLSRFFPATTAEKRGITIRQLLTHRSGIADGVEGVSDYTRVPRSQIASALIAAPLEFRPGEKESYSNGGYLLLAEIVEKVSGQRLEQFLQTQIFGQAGTSASYDPASFDRVAGGRDHFAGTAEWMDLRQLAAARNGPFGALWGAGGLYAPMDQAVLTMSILLAGQPPFSSLPLLMLTPATPEGERSLVLELNRSNGRICSAGHGGDATFARTMIRHFPETGMTIGVWANSISPSGHRAMRALEAAVSPPCSPAAIHSAARRRAPVDRSRRGAAPPPLFRRSRFGTSGHSPPICREIIQRVLPAREGRFARSDQDDGPALVAARQAGNPRACPRQSRCRNGASAHP